MMGLADKQAEFTSLVANLINYANNKGIRVKVVEWNRLLETQKRYVAEGKSKTMLSKHLDNLAVDLFVVSTPPEITKPYDFLGAYWRDTLKQRWGGDWDSNPDTPNKSLNDGNHFEFRNV